MLSCSVDSSVEAGTFPVMGNMKISAELLLMVPNVEKPDTENLPILARLRNEAFVTAIREDTEEEILNIKAVFESRFSFGDATEEESTAYIEDENNRRHFTDPVIPRIQEKLSQLSSMVSMSGLGFLDGEIEDQTSDNP